MPEIETESLKPVGEFGSKEWCERVAMLGAQLLKDAKLPSNLEWGFTEHYTFPPSRLVQEKRTTSGYFIMVRGSEISWGDGLSNECLQLPGFHVKIPWGVICNQSATLYGREGQRKRSEQERVLFRELSEYTQREDPLGLKQENARPAVWPQEIGKALGAGSEEGGGLHNIAARLQAPSPEFSDLPVTDMGVPRFSSMSEEQKKRFLNLCGVRF